MTLDAGLRDRLEHHIGRYCEKVPDWDAFPANRGFPGLARAQIRYLGAGGSPKVDDASTLPAEHFTLSLIFQEPGKYAAVHHHEIEEAFILLQGSLVVMWDFDGELVDIHLSPKDMIVNPPGRAHGFRNDGFEPATLSIMVGSGRPLAPVYSSHPKEGAAPSLKPRGRALSQAPERVRDEVRQHLVRFRERQASWGEPGFARLPYIGEGGVAARHFRDDVMLLPRGCGIQPHRREVEDAYFVLSGYLTVGWEEDGRTAETVLGPRDMLLNPARQQHYCRNEGYEPVECELVVGEPGPETIRFKAS